MNSGRTVVRSRGGLNDEFVGSAQWKDQANRGQRYRSLEFEMVDGQRRPKVNSISGKERNKMFLNRQGASFDDVSFLSGADSVADGRCFATWDYDHDGFQDLAVISMNSPHLQIFRNNRFDARNNFIAIKLVGGNNGTHSKTQWSNRDGVGAMVKLNVADKEIVREQKYGEGFSSQNSQTILIGIGEADVVDAISVTWAVGNSARTRSRPVGTVGYNF